MKLSDKLKNSIPQLTGDFETFKQTTDELLSLAKSEKEKDLITEFIASALDSNTEQLILDVKMLCLKVQLNEYKDIIPYSYIAKEYFNKSRAWLSQRINGYDGNKKKARFTLKEIETFNFALQDISKKIGSITI